MYNVMKMFIVIRGHGVETNVNMLLSFNKSKYLYTLRTRLKKEKKNVMMIIITLYMLLSLLAPRKQQKFEGS